MSRTKKLFAALIAVIMILSVLPVAAAPAVFGGSDKVHVYTDEENAMLDNGVFADIQAVKDASALKKGGIEKMKEADYIALIPEVIKKIESSDTYVKGTLQQNGNFLVWMTTVGIPCCFDPRMEAELHNTEDAPTPAEIAAVEAEAEALLDKVTELRGGSPTSKNIGLIQPYWESSSSYNDSSFLNYSPKYKTTWQNLYNATGGQGIRYSMSNATVDNIASTMVQCGLVIFDSHGTTDYSGSNEDYTSRANSSYLCLITNSGVTSTDTAAHTGTYGTYYDCIKGSGYAYVNGQCIANHMSGSAPHSMLYMGICLGMATDRMFAPLRDKGVEVVYGYSQSVTFTGELQSIQSIMAYIQQGMEAGAAIEQSQTDLGCQWDPAYPNYTETQARNNKVAFPVVASSEDTYPGHGNVDCVLTAYSTWTLFGESYTVTATSNNTSYGTVSVDGYTITASPKTGYYAQGYTVTSGTATVSQNGNIFTVTPSSDCTVRINFAAKTQYTVNFVASGTAQGSQTAYSGDAITLPSSVNVNPDGWTFKGWVANQIAETSTKPTFYNAGASYTVTGNATLYALYTRIEEGTGAAGYQLVDTIENGGKYIIVDSDSTSGTSGYAVGNTIVTNSHYLNAVSVTINSDNTCTVSSSNEAKVVWVAASSGSGWTFYNEAVGKYMGLDSSEYLYPSSTPLAWAYTSEKYLDNQSDSEGYYYLSYDSTNGRYTTSKNGYVINFYQYLTGDTTYYTTDPVAVTPNEYTVTFKDWDGTVLKTETVVEGGSATAPANPTREGYTFTGWSADFTNVTSDLIVTAQYTINSYTLTINYVKAEGGTAASTYTQTYTYGASYSVTSPTVEGYTPDQAVVTGTMGAGNVTITVTYTKNAPAGL
ncbi:MAG: InlB B-repeat-containing protein, partial [Clostridia bacterium]|nr:InlB B-repeat-containing protein [Clostridia bacterium]